MAEMLTDGARALRRAKLLRFQENCGRGWRWVAGEVAKQLPDKVRTAQDLEALRRRLTRFAGNATGISDRLIIDMDPFFRKIPDLPEPKPILNQAPNEQSFDFSKPTQEDMDFNIYINSLAQCALFHKRPFADQPAWLEFDLDSGCLSVITGEDGERTYKMQPQPKVGWHLRRSRECAVIWVRGDIEIPYSGFVVPVVKHFINATGYLFGDVPPEGAVDIDARPKGRLFFHSPRDEYARIVDLKNWGERWMEENPERPLWQD